MEKRVCRIRKDEIVPVRIVQRVNNPDFLTHDDRLMPSANSILDRPLSTAPLPELQKPLRETYKSESCMDTPANPYMRNGFTMKWWKKIRYLTTRL